MELTPSFLALLQHFTPVFTTPTFTTFVQIVTGWIFSQRHRFITEIIFSGGNIGDGHWSPVPSLLQPRRLGPRRLRTRTSPSSSSPSSHRAPRSFGPSMTRSAADEG